MRIDRIINALFGFSMLILINSPSIKTVFYSTELINLTGTGLLMLACLMRSVTQKKMNGNITIQISLITSVMMWAILLASVFWGHSHEMNFENLLQYINILVISTAILSFGQNTDMKFYIPLQIIWSLFIAFIQLTTGVQTDLSQGQHYLTVGFPLGIGFVALGGILFQSSSQKFKINKLLYILLLIVLMAAMLTLSGRSPIVFSILTMYLFWLFLIIKMHNKFRNIAFIIFCTVLGGFLLNNYANETWEETINLTNHSISEEARWPIYKYTFDLILNNVFGYGLNSYEAIVSGSYPHNILLEIAFYSGFLGLLFFLIFITIFLISVILSIYKQRQDVIILSMITIYILFIWNVSYSLDSSYVLFTGITAVIASLNNKINTNSKFHETIK